MKKVVIERMTLTNFKKIKDLSIDFSNLTQINGANGTGKSTVFDAFSWLLYGKNSHNQADFSIKTLDENNQAIPKIEHAVEGVFDIDGKSLTLKRVYLEKWVTKRGNDFEELSGHETKYFVDDVPQSKAEYESKVRDVIEENISKMISNPDYFNNQIGWKERREILTRMAGEITNENIIQNLEAQGEKTDEVIEILTQGGNFEAEKRKINERKKKIKDEVKLIPSRIDEVSRMKPEAVDFDSLKLERETKNKEIGDLDKMINDENEAHRTTREAQSKAKIEKFEKEETLKRLERENIQANDQGSKTVEELNKKRGELNTLNNSKNEGLTRINSNKKAINQLTTDNNSLREEWIKFNGQKVAKIEEGETCCPTCKRELENAQELKQNIEDNYQKERALKLKDNETKGLNNKKQITALEESNKELEKAVEDVAPTIKALEDEIEALNNKLKEPTKAPEPTPEMIALKKEIDEFIIPETKAPEVDEIQEKKRVLILELEQINKELNKEEQINKANERIEELNKEQKALSQELALLDRKEFQIDAFTKGKIELVEDRINSKFALVKFKMFEQQLNGGEAPACECMVEGVPFNDLNTAAKINAGLDIINALQYHFEIFSPVFIDQRESVSQLQSMNCQLISLKVDESAKELEILNL